MIDWETVVQQVTIVAELSPAVGDDIGPDFPKIHKMGSPTGAKGS
jgi:hypothetical protein